MSPPPNLHSLSNIFLLFYLGAADTVSYNYYIHPWQLTLLCQTVSAIYAFFLAMALHPDVASKAQQEIEAVVGTHRLPTFADREYLPYVSALTKEVLRWNSVVPLGSLHNLLFTSAPFQMLLNSGAPRRHTRRCPRRLLHPERIAGHAKLMVGARLYLQSQTSTDDDSRGMTHDPRRYRNPTVFNPERFIPSEGRHVEPDPYDVVFGFGRRYDPSLLFHK